MALWKKISRAAPRLRAYALFAGEPESSGAGALGELGLRFEEMTPETVVRAARLRPPAVVDTLRRYVLLGCAGYFVCDGEKIVAHGLLAVAGESARVFRRVRLYPGEAGVILLFTAGEYRGKGIGTALVRELSARAAGLDGVRRIVAWTVPTNAATRRVLEKCGWRREGTVWILEVFKRSVLRLTFGSGVKR